MNSLRLTSAVMSGTDANDLAYIINPYPFKIRVTAGYLVPVVAVSAHASNVIVTDVKKGSDTMFTQSTDTDTTGYAAHVAGTPIELSLSGTVAKVYEIAAGGVITCTVTKGGTGPAYELYIALRAEPIPA